MFIENLSKEELTYRAHGKVLKLKPGMNLVDEVFFKQSELERHFGLLINIYTNNAPKIRKVECNEKAEKPIIEDNNKDTVVDSQPVNKSNPEPEINEQINEDNGEEKSLDVPDNDNPSTQEVEQVQEETQAKIQESENQKTEEKKDEQTTETEGSKVEIQDLKRPQLIAKYKELGLEGSPIKLSNEALIKAILEKLG